MFVLTRFYCIRSPGVRINEIILYKAPGVPINEILLYIGGMVFVTIANTL